ncbi:MAG TPA: NAD(P)-dependent oxidoreductase [Thermoanaerobaculia bacterium]|nr:NAD(P)-dependent oxidoreductase [Thermoanaerobaculia bacterium]
MSKILITGATGVVGRRLVPILVGEGHSVVAMLHSPRSRAALELVGAAPVECDFSDVPSLRRAAFGCDAVVNLATHMPAGTLQMLRRSSWQENDAIRTRGSSNLVDAALAEGVGRFVQESFAPLYPDRGDRWIDEAVALRPIRYNRSVCDAEASAARFTKAGGAGVVLRFAAFYGPDSRFLVEGIAQLRRTGRAFYPGARDAFVSSVHHDDAATAAAAALGLPPGTYNVADDEPVTRRDYFDSLARALGLPPPKPFPWWARALLGSLGEVLSRSQRISNRKLEAAAGWAPRYRSVHEGWPSVAAALPAAA